MSRTALAGLEGLDARRPKKRDGSGNPRIDVAVAPCRRRTAHGTDYAKPTGSTATENRLDNEFGPGWTPTKRLVRDGFRE